MRPPEFFPGGISVFLARTGIAKTLVPYRFATEAQAKITLNSIQRAAFCPYIDYELAAKRARA